MLRALFSQAFTKSAVGRKMTHPWLLADHLLELAINSDYGLCMALPFRRDKPAAIGLIKTFRIICSLSKIYHATVVIKAIREPGHSSN